MTGTSAEVKADATTIWGYVKSGFAKVTSVVADILKAVSPQFTKAESTWKTYTPGKKTLAVAILAVGALLAWKFSVDITRLSIGSFRAASAYGHGSEVTKADIISATSMLAPKSDVVSLQAQIDAIVKSQTPPVAVTVPKKAAKKAKPPATTASTFGNFFSFVGP